MFINGLIVCWRISRASDGFASQDQEREFYLWMIVYFIIFMFQILALVNHTNDDDKKSMEPIYKVLKTFASTLPLCLYLFFVLHNYYGQHVNIFQKSCGFAKIFCKIKENDIHCRVEVQQLAPKSISDCEVHNSSTNWDFCGTLLHHLKKKVDIHRQKWLPHLLRPTFPAPSRQPARRRDAPVCLQ